MPWFVLGALLAEGISSSACESVGVGLSVESNEAVGAAVGESIGVGLSVGSSVGESVGGSVGAAVGKSVGISFSVSSSVGEPVGAAVGESVGVGLSVGSSVGKSVSESDGFIGTRRHSRVWEQWPIRRRAGAHQLARQPKADPSRSLFTYHIS
jgi:hypothetical protein